MQIICPNCGSKSPIEAGSLVTLTRIVCADCAVEFAAELSDEPASAHAERGLDLFRPAEVAPAPVAPAAEVVPAPADHVVPAPISEAASAPVRDVYEVLSLPEELILATEEAPAVGEAADDHSNVLEDVFAAREQARAHDIENDADATAADDESAAPHDNYSALARGDQEPRAAQHEHAPEETHEAADEEAESATDEHEGVPTSFAESLPHAAVAQSINRYDIGVRLMRVSPLWLLVSGLSFISFVVFCNWFFVPANLAQAGAARPAALRNEATNRSHASVATAADAAPSWRDEQNDSRPAPQPAGAEIVNASQTVELPTPAPTETPAATPAPTAEPTATPRAEQPKAAETVAPQPAGRFTVQVGSYNAASEAEARAAGLRSAGQTVRVVEVEIPKRGKWFRVYVGGFASRDEAESHGKTLRARGLAASYIATESQ